MERMVNTMNKIKNFEGINKKNIITMELIASDQDDPTISITELVDGIEQESQYTLTQGFQIHACNEFLRSLGIKDSWEINFKNYLQYKHQLQRLNHMLPVQRLIDAEGSDVEAIYVCNLLLDDKGDFGFNAHAAGLENGLLPEYVHKAIQILKERPMKKVECEENDFDIIMD